MFWIGILHIKNDNFLQIVLYTEGNCPKIPGVFFKEIGNVILKFIQMKKIKNS